MADSLEELNKCGLCKLKPTLKINNMEPDKAYPIGKLLPVQTKYGTSIIAELQEECIFLPKRVSELITVEDGVIKLDTEKDGKRLNILYRGEIDTRKSNKAALMEFQYL